MREIVGVIVLLQGLAGFVGLTFFDSKWGLLHRWFDIPSVAYLGIALAGLGLILWGESAKNK